MYHKKAVHRIRSKLRRGGRIKALFIVTETAKWKTQSLFEMMQHDNHYDPFVGVFPRDRSEEKSASEIQNDIDEALQFFKGIGDKCEPIYDCKTIHPVSLTKLVPDIVFYQQPWSELGRYSVAYVHRHSLTCYVPYFVPNIGFPEFEAQMLFHRFLAYFFLLNKGWITEYSKGVTKGFYSGRLVAVGHTMLDALAQIGNSSELESNKKTVIYAPHHSLTSDSLMKIGTFLDNGREMLRYAQEHREFNWIFRPHPSLKDVLARVHGWGEREQKKYYSEWATVGEVSDGGNYLNLFTQASVLITDCGSFLVEFAATGKPIIHLISKNADRDPALPTRELISTYYKVHNNEELRCVLDQVLVRGEDPLRTARNDAVVRAGLSGQNAAKNIMDFFDKEFKIKR